MIKVNDSVDEKQSRKYSDATKKKAWEMRQIGCTYSSIAVEIDSSAAVARAIVLNYSNRLAREQLKKERDEWESLDPRCWHRGLGDELKRYLTEIGVTTEHELAWVTTDEPRVYYGKIVCPDSFPVMYMTLNKFNGIRKWMGKKEFVRPEKRPTAKQIDLMIKKLERWGYLVNKVTP